MANRMATFADGVIRDWIPVTPNDGTDNVKGTASDIVVGFYVTVGGAVAFTTDGGTRTVTFPDNCIVYCSTVSRILSTGTTATGIHSLVL